jgi:integrase
MASRDFNPKTGKARIFFRYGGKQFNKTIRVKDDREALRACALIDETIQDLERGKLTLPPGADPAAFIISGGKLAEKPSVVSFAATVKQVFDTYTENLTPGSKERNSTVTESIHARHFQRVLGERRDFGSMDIAALQRYVDKRAAEGVVRATIKKELSTLRLVWAWALKRGHVSAPLTWKVTDLTLPKGTEKPPFRTWDQITQRIKRGAAADLWESLWLNQEQTLECLAWVKANAKRDVVYPLFALAAYTGARRGEMLRSERDDWDFGNAVVMIREKKADRSKTFTLRSVPIHPELGKIMDGWFGVQESNWALSMPDGRPLIPQTASEFFREVLSGGKWAVLHGFHTFRHSLASNMAVAGHDQRDINAILGHRTGDMERRYRHLCPRKHDSAISSLFRSG